MIVARRIVAVGTALAVSAGVLVGPGPARPSGGAPLPDRYVLPGARLFPESIGYQRATGSYFVGSLVDGRVLRGSVTQAAAHPFLPAGGDGRTSAAGIKVDTRGRLFVAGGSTGRVWVYDVATRRLLARFADGAAPEATLVNDIAVLPNGDAYVTDSLNPVLYRIHVDSGGRLRFEHWLSLTGTAITYYRGGLNLNGVAASADGRYLVVNQTNTGLLFRIDIATKAVRAIDLGGYVDGGQPLVQTLTHGDGILLDGRTLYVARNATEQVATVRLAPDFLSGRVVARYRSPAFHFPTSIVKVGGRLLVLNAQLDRLGPGLAPDLPFTVVGMPLPA